MLKKYSIKFQRKNNTICSTKLSKCLENMFTEVVLEVWHRIESTRAVVKTQILPPLKSRVSDSVDLGYSPKFTPKFTANDDTVASRKTF